MTFHITNPAAADSITASTASQVLAGVEVCCGWACDQRKLARLVSTPDGVIRRKEPQTRALARALRPDQGAVSDTVEACEIAIEDVVVAKIVAM